MADLGPQRTFAQVLADAVAESGLSLRSLERKLAARGTPVSRTALSDWSHARPVVRNSSWRALPHLEELLGLPPGTLSDRLTQPSPRTPPSAKRSSYPGLDDLITQLGWDPRGDWRTYDAHEFHYLGADGLPYRHVTRQVVMPTTAAQQPDRYVFFFDLEGLADVEVVAVSGCRARDLQVNGGIGAAVLQFNPEVRAGATKLFEYRLDLRYEQGPPPQVRRSVTRDAMLVLRVHFHPDALPAQVLRCRWNEPLAAPRDLGVECLDESRAASTIYRPSTAEAQRLLGLRWDWPRTRTVADSPR